MKCEKWTDQHDTSARQRTKIWVPDRIEPMTSQSLARCGAPARYSGGHEFDSCRGLRFFFVPRSCHADQFTFHWLVIFRFSFCFKDFHTHCFWASLLCTLFISQRHGTFFQTSLLLLIFSILAKKKKSRKILYATSYNNFAFKFHWLGFFCCWLL